MSFTFLSPSVKEPQQHQTTEFLDFRALSDLRNHFHFTKRKLTFGAGEACECGARLACSRRRV